MERTFDRQQRLVLFPCIFLCFFLGIPSWLSAQTDSPAPPVEIRILHTNDWHGQIRPVEWTRGESPEVVRLGGAVSLANAITQHRRDDPTVLLVSAGDWFQGTPEGVIPEGRLMVDLMNALGYDVSVAGNHEFDLGEETLRTLVARAQFPVLGSNILGRADGRVRPYLQRTAILEIQGIKLGFGGLLAEESAELIMAKNIAEIDFASEIDTAQEIVETLRRDGAEIVVFLNHIGSPRNIEIAERVAGIDVIIGGHDHAAVLPDGKMVGTTLVAQSQSHARALGVVQLTFDARTRALVRKAAVVEPLEYREGAENAVVTRVLANYRTMIDEDIDGPLAVVERVTVTEPMTRDRRRGASSLLGAWIADVIRDRGDAVVGFMNKGGIRKILPNGVVRARDFWEISPFDNTIVAMNLTGAQILALIEASFDSDQTHSGLDIAGMRVSYAEATDSHPLRLNAVIGESPLDPSASYRVATNSFLSEGGDGYSTFRQGTDVVDTGILLRDAELEAARSSRVITPPKDLRWLSVPPTRERGLPMSLLRGFVGLAVLVGLAWLLSTNRSRTPWRLVFGAIAMQLVIGLFLIKWNIGYGIFEALTEVANRLLAFTNEGATFVFGSLATSEANAPGLAFRALPTIIFFSCLMAILYHLRVMHFLIWCMAKVMTRTLGVTGAESMAVAANVFVGQTEAPLVVRRFIPKLTRSELSSLMTGGFATVAGSVLAAYISFYESVGGGEYVPHLLIASVMSAPAAFAISKIIVPETAVSETGQAMSLEFTPTADNVLDAAATGVSEGLKLWLNVVAMLLAFVALVALIDWPLGYLGESLQIGGGLSLSRIFGVIFAPIALAMGVDGADALRFGALLGTKIGLNEFLAYIQLQQEIVLQVDPQALATSPHEHALSKRTIFMATYALCGFANFSSLGIQIGGIAPLAPERRSEIIGLAFRAMLGGALASWMTASIAGMFF